MDETPKLRPIVMVLAAMFAFSLMAVFTRGAQADILGVAAWRAIFVAIVFGLGTVWRGGGLNALRPDGVTLRLGVWLGVALAVASSTFVGGYAFTTVANTIFLHNLAPVMVFPLAYWLFKERSGSAAVTGAGIALFGVAMLSGVSIFQVSHFASSRFLLGDFLAFVSAIGYAAVLVLTRMTRRENTPILATLTVAWVVAAVLLSVVAVVAGGFMISGRSLLWVFGLAVICTNVPFYLLNLGMRSVPAGMAAVLSLSEVLFATALGIGVYGERLAPIGWIGAVLAGLGVLYAVTQETEDETKTASELPESLRAPRLARAGLGLLLLNGGAIYGALGGGSGASLMTLSGLTLLARYGAAGASALLDGRFDGALRWVGAGLGALVVGIAYQGAGGVGVPGSLMPSVILLAVLLVDRQLAATEPAELRDTNSLWSMAVSLFILSGVLDAMGHGWAPVLSEGCNLGLAGAGLMTMVRSLNGGADLARQHTSAIERLVHTWSTGRRGWTAVVAVWLVGAAHVVPTGHVGIVERFGAPQPEALTAGLSLRLPPPIETLTYVDVGSERQLALGAQTMLTGDQSMVSLEAVLRYQVSDANRFAYALREPTETLQTLAHAALIDVVAHVSQDVLLTTGRAETEAAVLSVLQDAVDQAEMGATVSGFHLTAVRVPPQVLASFLDVITAGEEQQREINLAEAYAADVIPRARGEAVARIVGAQGEAERVDAEAIGYDVWFRSLQRNGRRQMAVTRARLRAESAEARLGPVKIVAAPAGVRVWLDDEAEWPRDPETKEGR